MADEFENLELRSLAEQQAKMAEEWAGFKHMMTQMSLMNEKLTNLEQFVVEIYQSLAVGRTLPPMPSYLNGLASTVGNGGQISHATTDVPGYSPNFPEYHYVTGAAKNPTVHHPTPPSQSQGLSSIATTQAVHMGVGNVGNEIQMKDNMTSVEASCKGRNGRQCYSQAPQATPPQQYFSSQNMQYAPPMPQYQVQPLQPFVQMPACHQSQAPVQQPRPALPQAKQNQIPPPSMPYGSRGEPGFCQFRTNRKPRRLRRKQFTNLRETYTSLFHKLHSLCLLNPVDPNVHPLAKVDPTKQCSYHSGALGHDTEACYYLKKAIQSLIDSNRIQLEDPDEAAAINQNPLPAHDVVHMVEMLNIEKVVEDSNKPITSVKVARASHELLLSNTIPGRVTWAVPVTSQDNNPVLMVKNVDKKKEEEHTVLADSGHIFGINMVQSGKSPSNAEI